MQSPTKSPFLCGKLDVPFWANYVISEIFLDFFDTILYEFWGKIHSNNDLGHYYEQSGRALS